MEVQWPAWAEALEPETKTRLAAVAWHQRFPRGSTIFLEGDAPTLVLFIQSGEVKVFVSSTAGREVVLDIVGPGELLGELGIVDAAMRSATAVALTDVEVLALPTSTCAEIARERPDLVMALLESVVRRLRTSDRRQLEFGGDALGRVCARLVEVADRQGVREIVLPVSQTDLAKWTGLSREAVVKALGVLRRLGWIETSDRQVSLVEIELLRARAAE